MSTKPVRCPTCHRRFKRSNDQNARYWALLHAISEKVKPGNGDGFSAETWHVYFKSKFLGCDEYAMPNGKTMLIPRSTADLDVSEFADYMTKLDAWAAERDVWLEDGMLA
jgi:hypothetical protein